MHQDWLEIIMTTLDVASLPHLIKFSSQEVVLLVKVALYGNNAPYMPHVL